MLTKRLVRIRMGLRGARPDGSDRADGRERKGFESMQERFVIDDLIGRRVSRRDLLRAAGTGGLGLAAASLLAACGAGGDAGNGGGPPPSAASRALPSIAGELSIAQWPLYIDQTAGGKSPTIQQFEQASGIHVDYREVIDDNATFYGKLVPELQTGRPTGYDLITLSDWVVVKLNRRGWIEPLDMSALPNVTANIGPGFADPVYDPGNAHSVPWQGGITGIAYDPSRTGRDLTSFADLWDPAFAGHVGMLTEMVDTMNLTLLSLGIAIEDATVADAEKARDRLVEQREAGIVRSYYGQNYTNALSNGDIYATMAWSGDVFQLQLGNPDLRFVVPEEGGILWATPMEIPAGAEHPADAHAFLDFVYQPDIAAQITEWVAYVTPVPAARDVIRQHAKEATSSKDRAYLETLAESPLVFPTDEALANLHGYKVLGEEEENQWNNLFLEVTTG